ncbi:MAG: hypothetical protein N2489_03830 [Clostridia bacterium]|nr:hypothetical protein [Clostridia bacterium]
MVLFVLKILGFISIAAGAVMVFGARSFVKKFRLDQSVKCDFENEFTEEELERYKFDKALVNYKMVGLLVALPGLVAVIYIYK